MKALGSPSPLPGARALNTRVNIPSRGNSGSGTEPSVRAPAPGECVRLLVVDRHDAVQGEAELAQAPPRREVPRRVLPYRVVRDAAGIERLETPEREVGRGHHPGLDQAHAVHAPPHRVVSHRSAGGLVEGAHPFLAIALVGGGVAVEFDDVALVARMAPGAVLLGPHDLEQVARGENPSLAVHHHVGSDGGGALALRRAA